MTDLTHFKKVITDRLEELDERVHEVDHELGEPKTADLNDQAIAQEGDEVLEGLGAAAEKEIMLLRQALDRIEHGTYGICLKCEEPISDARLEAVPYAPLCKTCAQGG